MNEIQREVRTKTIGYISTALGLVAGLAWNEAITKLIERLFPLASDGLAAKFIYALLVTVAIVILLRYLERVGNKDN